MVSERSRLYLTHFINQIILESQLPHKIVDIIFQSAIVNNKLTILWWR